LCCAGDRKGITTSVAKAFGFSFHEQCLKCVKCGKKFNNDGFHDDVTNRFLHLDCLTESEGED
jgi:hypothetical protein